MCTLLLDSSREENVVEAARLLRAGLLVAFPTETVYGLGARADDENAVGALLRVKERAPGKKLTILISDPEGWHAHAAPPAPAARALAQSFWPGPLTLVVADGRGGEVGLRCPDLPLTRNMLRLAAVPVVAPSANLSGLPPARDAAEAMAAFVGRIAAVLDGGPTRLGRASTVVRVAGGAAEILREGALSEKQIRAALGDMAGGEREA